MNKKGQAALEYLMTYGWALIVVAVVIAVLVYVTSTMGVGVTCAGDSKIGAPEWTFATGADTVGFTLQNKTGGTITLAADCVTATDGTYITEGATASVCPTSVASGANFTVTKLDGPAAGGTISNASATISYTTAGGLPATVNVVCNGKI